MPFDAAAHGSQVAAILAIDGDGQRLMPLVRTAPAHPEARELIQALVASPIVKAGLFVYFGFWDEAHETAQDIPTPEGSYWHAIVHRQEPDAGNARYWFGQVGSHAIFPALREQAATFGVDLGPRWSPPAFIDYCEQARRRPGSDYERRALETQRAEWQLLFDASSGELVATSNSST
jgi:hypothetical protein